MQKYIDQVDKYLKSRKITQAFLADDNQNLFFLKTSGSEIHLYHLNLDTQPQVVDLEKAKRVTTKDFGQGSFDFIRYFPQTRTLYASLDTKNNEFFNLFSIPLDSDKLEQVTHVQSARSFKWTADHKTIYFMNRVPVQGGHFKTTFHRMDMATREVESLFDDEKWKYKVGWGQLQISADDRFLIIQVDLDNKRELYNYVRVNIDTLSQFKTDPHPQEFPKLFPESFEDGTSEIFGAVTNSGFYFVSDVTRFENLYFYEFSSKSIKAITENKWINLTIGGSKHPNCDIIVVAEPLKQENKTRFFWLNTKTQKTHQKVLDGNYNVNGLEATVMESAYDKVPTYYVYDENLNFTKSFAKYIGADLVHSSVEILKYNSFDGLEILSYFARPKVPIKGVVVIAFYGGENHYSFYEQLFLENGIAILSPAVRGSWGFGREWEDHLKGDLGGKEMLDVIWGSRFISRKLDLPENKVGLWGQSHGGYAVLRTVTLPKSFAGANTKFDFGFAVCECGFADLENFFETSRIADWLVDLLGPYPQNKDLYKERSPANYFENLKTPLLIRHGTNDSRVPLSTVQSFIDKLEKSNIRHEIMIQENQGHHTNDPGKLKVERARILDFVLN